ncbi:MAG TPA: Vms1/Ankzf1 family peptidyl-tRNA hydrolase [Thermomicrobiales bacterium]|nr:Vms1/Ankzf1 family peptidyl-tRNA hydrolase [Thermomicrobiales bacterium]
MATDPTRAVHRRKMASPFEMASDALLDRLVGLPPFTGVPYLTVTIDWRVQGDSPGRAAPVEVKRSQVRSGEEEGIRWRPAIEVLEREIADIVEQYGPHGDAYESLKQDKERVFGWIENELDPAAHGAAIVANSSHDVFEASGFAIPLLTETHVGPTPYLKSIVRLNEDNPTYAVLLADQQDARLSFFTAGLATREVTLVGTGYPRHQSQGGWSQRRYQARADERIEAFARDVADETRKALDRLDVDSLIVAGNEVMTSALSHEFHETVKARIIDTIHLDITATDDEVLEATQPIADRAERQREATLVANIRDQVGSDGRGAAGPQDTLQALQIGQVQTLAMVDTFEGGGWADFDMQVFGVGAIPVAHPAGGDVSALVAVDLPNEMLRLALASGAGIDVIHSDVPAHTDEAVRQSDDGMPIMEAAASLNEIGGVGALLRYALDETAPPESV